MTAGRRGRRRTVATIAVVGASVAAGCGGDERRVAQGADLDRPPEPSMDLVEFVDVAADVGLEFRHGAFQWETGPDPTAMMGGGLCWIDHDRDGWLDLYVVNTWSNGEWGAWRGEVGELPASRLFRNDAGRFADVTDEVGARVETRGNGCVAADLDLDGWTDLYVTTERDNVLLWNDEGRFVDDALSDAPSGVAAFGWHSGAAVGDVDGNGWPDLFVAGYTDLNRPIPSSASGFPTTHHAEPDLLFLNDGPVDGVRARFREVAEAAGIEPDGPDHGLGAVLTDLDRDGDLDLYVANDTTPNDLYENRTGDDGRVRFVEIGEEAGVGDDGAGMGVASGDVDGDAAAELVVTNQLDERHVVFRRTGSGFEYDDALADLGVADLGVGATGWGVTWIDADLDTDLDLFAAHGAIPVRDLDTDRETAALLENVDGSGRMADATAAVGLDAVGPRLGRGAAAADFDNDGDMDVAMATIGGDLSLLRNNGAGGTWLVVATPAPAPGAIVEVELPDGTVLVRELHAGSSYLSSEDPRAHVGLGGAERVSRVTVRWPDGDVTTLTDVAADQILVVEPGDR